MKLQRIVIVGAGPAGVAAAAQCQRLGVSPLLLDRTGRAGGLVSCAFSVENYPGLPPTEGPAFAQHLEAHLERFGLSVTPGDVQEINLARDPFELSGNFGTTRAESVIVSVGTAPRRLQIPGAEHIRYSPNLSGLTPGDRVHVVGGGEAALDYALSLTRAAARVAILVRRDTLNAHGRLVELVENTPDIELQYESTLNRIRATEQSLEVEIGGDRGPRRELSAQIVAAVGRAPFPANLISGLDFRPPKTVSTERPGLFVAGDARFGSLGQTGMAVGDGLAAAMEAVAFLNRAKQC